MPSFVMILTVALVAISLLCVYPVSAGSINLVNGNFPTIATFISFFYPFSQFIPI